MSNKKGVAYIIVLMILTILAFVVLLFSEQVTNNTRLHQKLYEKTLERDLIHNVLNNYIYELMYVKAGDRFSGWTSLGSDTYALPGGGRIRFVSGKSDIDSDVENIDTKVAISVTANAREYKAVVRCNDLSYWKSYSYKKHGYYKKVYTFSGYNSVVIKKFIMEEPD